MELQTLKSNKSCECCHVFRTIIVHEAHQLSSLSTGMQLLLSPLLQTNNLFPSIYFSLSGVDKIHIKRDLANMEDTQTQDCACFRDDSGHGLESFAR